jgi:uncharacterized protein (TIGR00369 family)
MSMDTLSPTDADFPAPLAAAPLSREAIRGLTGLQVLQGMLRGDLPPPPFSATTRIYPVEANEGHVIFDGEPSADYLNPLGTVHGGWISALLDSAMACAVHSRLAAGQSYTTVELKINFVRAVTERMVRVRCEGRVVHFGGRLATAEGRITDLEGRLLAHGTETCLIMDARG